MAAALRAGARVTDLEFVQFHPTVLCLGEGATGQQPLISEAVRGEGAFLVDGDGVRFMQGRHELADLAPRDVVARAIVDADALTGESTTSASTPGTWARTSSSSASRRSSPRCRELGFDPATDLLPVAPAQHYACGGVETDLLGRSSLEGLYACGEVLVHRRPRRQPARLQLAARGARLRAPHRRRHHRRGSAAGELPTATAAAEAGAARCSTRSQRARRAARDDRGARARCARPARWRDGAARGARRASPPLPPTRRPSPGPAAWETTNLLHLGQAADRWSRTLREETRGGHLRSDFPDRDDEHWLRPPHDDAGPPTARSRRRTPGAPPGPGMADPAMTRGPTGFPHRRGGGSLVGTALDEDLGARHRTSPRSRPSPRAQRRTPTSWPGPTASWPGCRRGPRVRRRGSAARVGRARGRGRRRGRRAGARAATCWPRLRGATQASLVGERTMLNILCRLSGVATHTRRWADALEGTGRDGARHPQDDPRAARPGEVRRALRRRHQQAHGPLRRGDDQGQPQARRRLAHGGVRRGPRARSRTSPSRSR